MKRFVRVRQERILDILNRRVLLLDFQFFPGASFYEFTSSILAGIFIESIVLTKYAYTPACPYRNADIQYSRVWNIFSDNKNKSPLSVITAEKVS